MKYQGNETPQIRSTQSGASPGDTVGPLKFRNLSISVGIQTLEGQARRRSLMISARRLAGPSSVWINYYNFPLLCNFRIKNEHYICTGAVIINVKGVGSYK